jgi:hypothetical protein
MRRSQRLIAAAVLIAFSGVLGGCSSGFGAGWDPTDLLDWLDTKKKLPGERKPVFPDGVPGLEQGVPKELYKDNVERQQQLDQQNAAVDANAPPQQPLEPPPGSKQAIKKAKAKAKQQPAQAAEQPAAEPDGEAAIAGQEDATQAAPPAPKPKKIARKRTTAPPPDQPAQAAPQATQSGQAAQSAQQSPAPFPAPLPGGSFTR